MEFLIIFFVLTLLLDIFAYCFFAGMLTNCRNKIAFCPKLPTPKLLLDLRNTFEDFTSRYALNYPDNFRWTIAWNRLNKKMHMVFINTNFQKLNFIAFSDFDTNFSQFFIDLIAKNDTTILGWTYNVINQD